MGHNVKDNVMGDKTNCAGHITLTDRFSKTVLNKINGILDLSNKIDRSLFEHSSLCFEHSLLCMEDKRQREPTTSTCLESLLVATDERLNEILAILQAVNSKL